jgi:catechol 2,3-dioxygenase-like lactoylglutathione lyase family enzyme
MRPHVAINVKNVEKSVEFYEKVFNVKPQKQTSDYAKFDLQNPALNFSMQSHSGSPISHVNHFGIEMDTPEDLLKWQLRLVANGIKVDEEKQTDCCYARQDKAWFKDPDGNSWEIFHVYEQLPVHPSATKTGQCCS